MRQEWVSGREATVCKIITNLCDLKRITIVSESAALHNSFHHLEHAFDVVFELHELAFC